MLKTKNKANFTEGPIFTRLLLFVVPLIITGVLQVMYNMADNIVVGRFSGDPDALGAVGSTSSVTTLIINIMISLSSGAGVVVAQYFGAKDHDKVSRTVHTSMALSVIGGIILMIIGIVFARPLLTIMGTKELFYEKAVLYMIIICCGIPASSIYNFGAAILRSIGDSKTSLYILATSGLVNVVLNLFFVMFCHMTVDGVAYATIISQYMSAVAVVWVLMRRRGECYQLNLRKLRMESGLIARIMRIGVPMALQSSLFSISNIIITSSVNTFPEHVVSAKTIAFNIEGLTYTVMHAFANAAMTFIGQNFGAQKYRRLNKVFLYTLIQVTVAGILVSQVEILFGRQLSSLYIDSTDPNREAIIEAVLEIFRIMLTTYFLCGVMEVISGVLKGIGFSVTSMVASLIGLVLRVGWIVFVTPTEKFHTIFGLFVSYTLSWILTIVLLLLCCAYAWHKLGIWCRAKEEKITEISEKEKIYENTY
ncbi:MAG: MATE family efflux transporter [Ruminococcaceae bacterium]|nr:MATE family efflux transporter [Oscillospiraceae bacterium]